MYNYILLNANYINKLKCVKYYYLFKFNESSVIS